MKFFAERIGSLPGGGVLMQALGFDFVVAQDTDGVEEPCFELPLSRSSPQLLRACSDSIDAALVLVRAL